MAFSGRTLAHGSKSGRAITCGLRLCFAGDVTVQSLRIAVSSCGRAFSMLVDHGFCPWESTFFYMQRGFSGSKFEEKSLS